MSNLQGIIDKHIDDNYNTMYSGSQFKKMNYVHKFVIRQPIFLNDGLFCFTKSELYA